MHTLTSISLILSPDHCDTLAFIVENILMCSSRSLLRSFEFLAQ